MMTSEAPASDQKLIILKPVVWNSEGYLGPAGSRSAGGYVKEHGFGHEEWNGDPNREWDGFRIFHTEGRGRMDDFRASARLGMIMTAYRPKHGPVALGIATSVQENSPRERQVIARALRIRNEGDRIWAIPAVRKSFIQRSRFDAHWTAQFENIRWRAPSGQYVWFEEPIPIDPEGVFPSGDPARPRKDIVKRHGGYMPIRPDQALAILGGALPDSHPVVAWLDAPPFDLSHLNKAVRNAKALKRPKSGSSAAPAQSPYVRWLTKQEIEISPRHHQLQSRFKAYISRHGSDLAENRRGVDLQYVCPSRGFVLVEVKPCEEDTARFAIRTALGQLLDYRQSASGAPGLLIVLEIKPTEERDIQLALSNNVAIAWPKGKGFTLRWPG